MYVFERGGDSGICHEATRLKIFLLFFAEHQITIVLSRAWPTVIVRFQVATLLVFTTHPCHAPTSDRRCSIATFARR
jgi:hypothetical protein